MRRFRSDKNKAPIILLDIDGVLSPMGSMDSLGSGFKLMTFSGFSGSIRYNPDVVDFFECSHRLGRAEVRWLTSWGEEANLAFGQIGVGPFKTYCEPNGWITWWKAQAVQKLLQQSSRRIIWVDDQIGDYLEMQPEVRTLVEGHRGRLFTFCPRPMGGISSHELDEIRRLILTTNPKEK